MDKLLIICGPTATGKTFLALHLAKVFGGELISADSRQVYKHMDIGTGKEIPKGFGFRKSDLEFKGGEVGYFTDGDTRIWGYDLVEAGEEFSVAQYVKFADEILKNVLQRGKLPILVGGTGLYIKGVVNGIDTAKVPKNKTLRNSLKNKGASELFEILASLDPTKAASMNISDRRNPRRLVRAIEIAEYGIGKRGEKKIKRVKLDALYIGLSAAKEYVFKLISERIKARFKAGLEGEVKNLILKRVSWDSQAMSALGYSQWRKYFEEKASMSQVINQWNKDEKSYARRQLTWFKRDKRVFWFDISKNGWQKSVEKLVKKWYSSKHNGFA